MAARVSDECSNQTELYLQCGFRRYDLNRFCLSCAFRSASCASGYVYLLPWHPVALRT